MLRTCRPLTRGAMKRRPHLLGICIAALVAFAAIGYLLSFALDWPRLYANALQRFPGLSPEVVGAIQAGFGCFSAPTLLAFAAVGAAISSRRPILLPLIFAAFTPVHILVNYVLLAVPSAWLVFQALEAGALFLTIRLSNGPNLPLNPGAPPIGGAPVS